MIPVRNYVVDLNYGAKYSLVIHLLSWEHEQVLLRALTTWQKVAAPIWIFLHRRKIRNRLHLEFSQDFKFPGSLQNPIPDFISIFSRERPKLEPKLTLIRILAQYKGEGMKVLTH